MMPDEEFTNEFDRAMELKIGGAAESAVEILFRLLDTGLHRPAVVGELGGILYYELRDPVRALPFVQQSVVLSPHSELASLGLFHVLLALDRVDEAFDEMRRYLKDHTSEAYEEFLRDVNAT